MQYRMRLVRIVMVVGKGRHGSKFTNELILQH